MDCRKRCSLGCNCVTYSISFVLAAIVGILYFFGLIINITVALWIALGMGVLGLIILFIAQLNSADSPCGTVHRCVCEYGGCLLIGSVGAIVFALVALALVFIVTIIPATIVVAICAFFAFMAFISLISLLACIVYTLCCGRG